MKTKKVQKGSRLIRDAHMRDWFFYKLQKIEYIDRWIEFVRTYVHEFQVRPMIMTASISYIEKTPVRVLHNVRLLLGCSTLVKPFTKKAAEKDIAVSLFHELCHVHLYAIDIPGDGTDKVGRWYHDEKMIEETAVILAEKFPQITSVFEGIFDCDLSVVYDDRKKEFVIAQTGDYVLSPYRRPTLQLELFCRHRLKPEPEDSYLLAVTP